MTVGDTCARPDGAYWLRGRRGYVIVEKGRIVEIVRFMNRPARNV